MALEVTGRSKTNSIGNLTFRIEKMAARYVKTMEQKIFQ